MNDVNLQQLVNNRKAKESSNPSQVISVVGSTSQTCQNEGVSSGKNQTKPKNGNQKKHSK